MSQQNSNIPINPLPRIERMRFTCVHTHYQVSHLWIMFTYTVIEQALTAFTSEHHPSSRKGNGWAEGEEDVPSKSPALLSIVPADQAK